MSCWVIQVYQLLAHGRWFSPDTPASSTTKTGCHDIAEILLKVALKHQKSKNQSFIRNYIHDCNMGQDQLTFKPSIITIQSYARQ
jgi:hypothetical protein